MFLPLQSWQVPLTGYSGHTANNYTKCYSCNDSTPTLPVHTSVSINKYCTIRSPDLYICPRYNSAHVIKPNKQSRLHAHFDVLYWKECTGVKHSLMTRSMDRLSHGKTPAIWPSCVTADEKWTHQELTWLVYFSNHATQEDKGVSEMCWVNVKSYTPP